MRNGIWDGIWDLGYGMGFGIWDWDMGVWDWDMTPMGFGIFPNPTVWVASIDYMYSMSHDIIYKLATKIRRHSFCQTA